uniref:Ubiquitin-like protease family profile domain-containing protein n=1 Tax=Oryza rufipogon TaxID=4529 RepID=A0A0E0NF74_ORYRU
MVHIEEVEVKRIRMNVLTQPEFLNDDVMDAYIQCLRYNEKGIRGDGKAFLEMAIKTGLLNVEGAHVEASKPRDKRWIRDMARDYLAFDMIFLLINIKDTHWYLAVLNAKRREVQILYSLAKPISKDRPDLRRVKDVKTFRQDLAGILINSELSKIKDRPLLPTTT